ncbi:transport protein [Companilactobacillus mindensis DSM 14500]|uniref:Transport protein n=1 Tax=Companilactobacillus mindensis DSM 14500 TaxID=1423770 RepID=A0A0R1QH80_9LACO|nr:MFS transporter [Companilactobacillus mindensis]KRL44157.1 transport protein [Companilactobacillus mindensis DSM 14500]GEO79490.1 MFS transporter [Companilactobacillus mindensis]
MSAPKLNKKWFLLSMMLIAANLRLPITIIPPLLSTIEKNLGIPKSLAGLITSIPLITFAVFSPVIVKLAKKFGNELTVFIFFIVLIAGSFLRIIPVVWALMLGTFLAGIGIDSGNVLVPAMIKDHLPNQIPLGTSLYTMSMLLIGAIGTALSGILITKISLQATLAILSTLAIVAAIFWIPNLRYNQKDQEQTAAIKYRSVWNQSLGWLITAFFGLQSLVYYSFVTWLPSILESHGISSILASNLLTVLQLSGLPCSFIVPFLSVRKHGMKWLLTMLLIGYAISPLGYLLTTSNLVFLSIITVLTGFGSGLAFNMAVIFFTEKTTNPYQTAEVSGMAQSAGYLLAAVGPVTFGYLENSLNSWNMILVILAVMSVLLTLSGVLISRHKAIAE